jgi:hypothetical protein
MSVVDRTIVHMDSIHAGGNPVPRPVFLGDPEEWLAGGSWLYPMVYPAKEPVTVVRRVDEYGTDARIGDI